MHIFLTVLHLLACVVLIVVVLLQRGKGADMGAMFGAGASATVFGSRGAGNFFTKLTTAAVVTFFVTSLSFNYMASQNAGGGLFEGDAEEAIEAAPAAEEQEAPAFEEVGEAMPAKEAKAPEQADEAPADGEEEGS